VRLYTLEEARALLPRIMPVLAELKVVAGMVREHMETVATQQRVVPGNGHLKADAFTDEEAESRQAEHRRWEACIKELTELGIEIKDPESGLIDFYHERDGEVVFLCYRHGEPDIDYWHTLQGGFAGRRPL
jgi:hypothetical protein